MMWAARELPQNRRLPVVGGGREAVANDARGVDVRKNREAPFCPKKKQKKREVTWNFGESPPTIVMVWVYIRVCMYYGYDMGKNFKASCSIVGTNNQNPTPIILQSRSPKLECPRFAYLHAVCL